LRWPDLDNIAKTAHVQAASVVGVLKGTKTKAGTRKVELNSEALAALQAQKQFTFMKSEFIFSDPKTGEPWANADAIRKKAWVPTLKKLAFDTVTRTRPATHSPPDILARALTFSGLPDRWGIKGRKCCSAITVNTWLNTTVKPPFLQLCSVVNISKCWTESGR
jgi:hypothetical protein